MSDAENERQIRMDNKKKKKVTGAAVGIAAAAVIFFFVYFHVDTVMVMGSSYYTEDEIKEIVLKGPLATNSVLAPMLYSKSETEDIAFVEAVKVSRENRHTLCISVEEIEPVGCVKYLDCYMYFDKMGMVIASSVERDMRVPYFEGTEIDKVVLGEEIPFVDESMLNTAVSLSRIFDKSQEVPDHITFDDNGEITLIYGEITAMLGQDKYLDDKMTRLIAIMPNIKGQKGILHLENVNETKKVITFEKELTPEELAAQEQEKEKDGKDGESDGDSDSSGYDSSGYDSSGYDSGGYDNGYDSGYDSSYDS